MAKTPKLKKPNPTSNPRSRASKRATSPSIDLDKSLTTAAHNNNNNTTRSPPILAARPGAGVTKKKSKRGNAKTRGQKIRQERGLQRAEAVMDQLEKKVEGAREREGRHRERRKVWEDVNSGVTGVAKKANEKVGGSLGGLGDWEDVEEVEEVNGERDGDQEMEGLDGAEATSEGGLGVVEAPVPVEAGVLDGETAVVADHTTNLTGVELEDEIT